MTETKNGESPYQVPTVASREQIHDFYHPSENHRKSTPLHKKVNINGQEITEPTQDQLVDTITPGIRRTSQATLHELYHQLHPEKFNK